MKNKKYLSIFLSLALILSNLFGFTSAKSVFAGTGVPNDPYSVAEAMAVAAKIKKADATTAVTVAGYIVAPCTVVTPPGIIIADINGAASDAKETIYVLPGASDQANKVVLANWNTPDKVGKKVVVSGYFRIADGALYGGRSGRPCVGTVNTKPLVIYEYGTTPPAPVPITGLGIDKTTADLAIGGKVKLGVTFTPDNTTDKSVTLVSKNPTVATVDASGLVSGVALGTSQIEVTSTVKPDLKAVCTVTVKSAPTIDLSTIGDARAKKIGSNVKINGIVSRISGSSVFIQDETAGVCLFSIKLASLSLAVGDKVEAVGATTEYGYTKTSGDGGGIIELIDSTNLAYPQPLTVAKIGSGTPIEPITIKIADFNEGYESKLIKFEKLTLGATDANKNTTFTDMDGKTIISNKMPTLIGISAGDLVDVVGLGCQYKGATQITIVNAADVVKAILPPDTVSPVIAHTAITAGNIGQDLVITATAKDDRVVSAVNLYHKATGDAVYKNISMVKTTGNDYSASIAKVNLDVKGLEYYIEVLDAANNKVTSPTDITKPYSVVISAEDTIAPEITLLKPADNSSVGNNFRPEISASYSDMSKVNVSEIKLFVDGLEVTKDAKITDSNITYTPTSDMAKSKHTVKLTVVDSSPKANSVDKTWGFSIGKAIYNPYFGQLHAHTAQGSDGTGTYEDAYQYAEKAGGDFFALTDHSNWFDNDLNYTVNGLTSGKPASTKWNDMHTAADKYNNPGKYVTMAAYEMTWSGSTGGWGHINTFNTPGFETRTNNKMDLQAYYKSIATVPNSISQLNHPGKTFGDFSDFAFYTPQADKVVNLIEVGNGEGQVRGSGYFPSYEYYTRALDKGWHVAPTNNQDNHKGKWVDANTARTVVLAPDLTRDSLYEAMSAKRVYASEDNNLKISYIVNGKPMGSMLGNVNTLNVTINIQDPDATDKIGKVSIIANGGTVVTSKTFDSNKADWSFDLNAEYSYYYVRVDEADKDIAVTAPVWVGENTPAGLAKVEVSSDLVYVGTDVDVTANLFNNTQAAINDTKVEFYKNEIKPENKFSEQTISLLNSLNTGKAVTKFTPTEKGDYKIYAKATMNISGVVKEFVQSVVVSAGLKSEIAKVVIDGGHQNQYVTGDYAGKMITFTAMLKAKGALVSLNQDELTASDLDGAKILVITDPQSYDKTGTGYNLKKSNFTDAELQVVKNFVANGGNVIVTSKADYGDGTGEYTNGVQATKILEAVGTNLRLNDDEVVDNTNNIGTTPYRLAFTKFTSNMYGLTDNIPVGQTYSFYSGCSVYTKPNADLSKMDWMVKGHDTTETLDSDKQGDSVPVTKGDVKLAGAEILPSGSKVIVAGSTFFSDFEVTGDNINANLQITNNMIDWMLTKSVELKTIAEVRVDANNDGIPDNMGKYFAVEGIVTVQSEAVTPKNAFFESINIQDATGGITVFGVSKAPIPIGTKVRVTGMVDQYQGDAEIRLTNELKDLQIIDTTPQLVAPKEMTTTVSMLEANEGVLVKVTGKVVEIKGQSIFVDDGSGKARVYVEGYIGNETGADIAKGKWDPSIKVGDRISAIGIASEDPEGHRIRVRNVNEIILQAVTNTIKVTDVTGVRSFKLGEDAKVSVNVVNNYNTLKKATLILSLLDEKNKMVKSAVIANDIKAGDSVTLTATIKVPDSGKYKLRAMIWDSIENMFPLSKYIDYQIK